MLVVHKFIKRSQIKNHAVDMSRLSGIFQLLLTQEIFPTIFTLNTNGLESLHYIFIVPAQRKITIARSHVNSHMALKP